MLLVMKLTQSCLTLCDPMDYTVHGILQTRILEWVAVPFLWDLSNPGLEPTSPTLQVDSLPGEQPGKPIFMSKWLSYKCLIYSTISSIF